jgi:hypothetical protein
MNTLTIIAIIIGIPWFILGWVALAFILTKSKECRSAYNAEILQLMRERSNIDSAIVMALEQISDSINHWKL